MLVRLLLLVLISATWLAPTAGCGKKGGHGDEDKASCKAVGEQFLKLSRGAVDRLEGEEKKHAEAMLSLLPKLRNNLVTECEEGKWSKEARECMMAAKDEKEAKACQKHLEGTRAPARDIEKGEAKERDGGAAAPAKAEPAQEAAGAAQ